MKWKKWLKVGALSFSTIALDSTQEAEAFGQVARSTASFEVLEVEEFQLKLRINDVVKAKKDELFYPYFYNTQNIIEGSHNNGYQVLFLPNGNRDETSLTCDIIVAYTMKDHKIDKYVSFAANTETIKYEDILALGDEIYILNLTRTENQSFKDLRIDNFSHSQGQYQKQNTKDVITKVELANYLQIAYQKYITSESALTPAYPNIKGKFCEQALTRFVNDGVILWNKGTLLNVSQEITVKEFVEANYRAYQLYVKYQKVDNVLTKAQSEEAYKLVDQIIAPYTKVPTKQSANKTFSEAGWALKYYLASRPCQP